MTPTTAVRVELFSSLKWSYHIHKIIRKAKRSLGFFYVLKVLKVKPSNFLFDSVWSTLEVFGTRGIFQTSKEQSGELEGSFRADVCEPGTALTC